MLAHIELLELHQVFDNFKIRLFVNMIISNLFIGTHNIAESMSEQKRRDHSPIYKVHVFRKFINESLILLILFILLNLVHISVTTVKACLN